MAMRAAVQPVKTGFCVSFQSFVTCLLAGTPIQSEQFADLDAGTVGAACWLISS
jgi:hypothetical protein